ncbi:error-prone DNA polymerase [Pedobacter arcticus]|uniref:error-prone DNA polymerase n=1 Tax=Pedobacter arcticus TaxID=752140 RepID=UPI00031A86D3|nr:error-prone DNA polymerase [Pedobacter arcticus]
MDYSELQVTSNFSFLRGASHPHELMEQAALLGYKKIAITDRNTLAGIVRAHVAAKKHGIAFIPACRLDLLDGPSLLAYPTDRSAYSRLSALLSVGNLRAEKGKCFLYRQDVFDHAEGILFIIIPPDHLDNNFNFSKDFVNDLKAYQKQLAPNLFLATVRSYQGDDQKRLHRLWELSQQLNIPLVATNDVHYHQPARRELQDVLTCVREKCTITEAGFKLHANAERYLKPIQEMQRLFRQYPEAIANAQKIADACNFSLGELKYVYPEELTTEGRTPQQELIHLTWIGAHERFGKDIPPKIEAQIREELAFIEKNDLPNYFLTVQDLVRFARSKAILCQGRGSAANSVVCYCLGITSVDPTKIKLLFARFMSDARNEPPDIDVDFEHERREEVIQYIYEKYGRERAAIVATVTQERYKGAIRDVGKAMGLSVDTINNLSASVLRPSAEWLDNLDVEEQGLNVKDPHLKKTLQLTRQLIGFPRQLGQHTGGFVITQHKLSDLCPIMNARMEDRTCIEWNKDDIEALGFIKVDVLALGMLTCIRKAFDLVKTHYNEDLTLANVKQDDPKVYKMISLADTVGVFQIESRAQMSMLPRLRPKEFYDLVIEVAIVRPGPIQGDMVHPYLRRRNGEDPITYPSKELEDILSRTNGVPLFQEQAMEIAIVAAGFTPAEADELRRSMATFKAHGQVSAFRQKLVAGMEKKGYDPAFAHRVFKQIEGFGSYGFPESHAASFALLVYVSSWIKCHYPDVFACAILNSLPMGFYQPAQLVMDAQNHGVEVREVDINYSFWDYVLEEQVGEHKALRLGFRQIKGLNMEEIALLLNQRKQPYRNVTQLLNAGLSLAALEKLADADAFRSVGLDRRQALWEVAALADSPIALFKDQPSESRQEVQIALPLMPQSEHVVHDYASTSLSLKAHPLSFLRPQLDALQVTGNGQLKSVANGTKVKVAGLVLIRQRPGTAKGVCFVTIEDETGSANTVVWENIFNRYRKEVIGAKLLMIEGKLQKEGEVIHVVAERCFDLSKLLQQLKKKNNAINGAEVFDRSRNFK